MARLPILNQRLCVQAVGFRPWEDGWIGVLITPWMMNLVLLPGEDPSPAAEGSMRLHSFPAGDYEFHAAHEALFGAYEACSLFSPMQAFADQASAVAVAEEAMSTLLKPMERSPQAANAKSRKLSRRDLLRGRFRVGG